MKTKIINILNKIANGEEPPKKIMYCDDVYVYTGEDYFNRDNDEHLFDDRYFFSILNDEVEILETTITYKQHKKIEPLKEEHYSACYEIISKINEIIDRIN